MDIRNRFRWVIGFALLICAVVLVWVVASDDPAEAPVEHSIANTKAEPPPSSFEQAQQQEVAEKVPDNAPPSASGALRGKVIDALTREPIRAFEVGFHQARGTYWRKDTPAARDFRTKDGRFTWQSAPVGVWLITVTAPGYQRFEIDPVRIDANAATTEFVMPMRKGSTVRGRVFDKFSGLPIASASVSFRDANVGVFEGNFRARPYTLTDKDGAFALQGAPLGGIVLIAWAKDYASQELNVMADDATPMIEIALSSGASIAGRLVAQDGTTAVVGWVGFFDVDREFGSSRRTNELGEFSFKQLAPGRYRLVGKTETLTAEREIALSDSQRLDDVALVLAAGRTLRGTVSGLSPAELSQARIELLSMVEVADDGASMNSTLDAHGAFELRGLRAGRVTVEARTPRRAIRKTVDISTDADAVVDLRFEPGSRLHGRVTKGGKPIVGAGIGLSSGSEDGFPTFGAATGQDGRYAFYGVPPGTYSIDTGIYSQTILLSGDTELDIDVPTSELRVEVLDEKAGVPLVGARLSLWSATTQRSTHRAGQSDHFGRFSFGSLETGRYVLTVYRPGFALHREQIELPTQPFAAIRMSAEEGRRIQVLDASSTRSLTQLRLREMVGYGIAVTVGLDASGEGRIPSGLAGSPLAFSASGCETIKVPNWDGQALRLAFHCSAAAGDSMFD